MLNKNIEALAYNRYSWFSEFTEEKDVQFIIHDNEQKESFFQNKDNQILCVKDEYERPDDLNIYKKQVIFVIGIYSLNEIKHLCRDKHKESILVIIEPRTGFFEYVLNNKDLTFLNNEKIFIFADKEIDKLQVFTEQIMKHLNFMGLFRNPVLYLTHYYRNFELELVEFIVEKIRLNLSLLSLTIGNSAIDSLQGLENNMKNLKYLMKSKSPVPLKNKFENTPAVVVSAGPSLNKNMHILKEYQNKIIIIAVDTIVDKLMKENITPDFVCSVERTPEVYDFFYKNRKFPKETTLVAPLVLDSRIFREFPNDYIIPFRTEVYEFRWLKEKLEIKEDVSMPVGLSCAHMAFGMAQHLGCSPIILIGQDLAYDKDTGSSHTEGTYYDEISSGVKVAKIEKTTDGYYGETVKTSEIWLSFKKWFEIQIIENEISVINATEGGARIFGTTQMNLCEALKEFAGKEELNIYKVIRNVNTYNIDAKKIVRNFEKEKESLNEIQNIFKGYFSELSKLSIPSATSIKEKLKINELLEKVHNLIDMVAKNQLLLHNTQSLLAEFMWAYQDIEDIITTNNLLKKLSCIGRLTASIATTIQYMMEYLDVAIEANKKF